MTNEVKGTVKNFDPKKGWGWIIPDGAKEGDKDVFVHYSNIQDTGFRTLKRGQKVSFVIEHGPKGKFATDVIVIEDVP